ncbi:MAG: protein-disulfide reductase DsbD family protein [Oligoflexales bacterium]
MLKKILSLLFIFVGLPWNLYSQGLFNLNRHNDRDVQPSEVVHWSPDNITMISQNTGELRVRLQTDHDFTLYQDQLKFKSADGFPITPKSHPVPKKVLDPISGEYKNVYDDGDFVLEVKIPDHTNSFPLAIRYISCTSKICLFPYTENLDIPVIREHKRAQTQSTSPLKSYSLEQGLLQKFEASQKNFTILLLIALLGGLLTNLTPCVYPMIPITIRLLSTQTRKPLLGSCAYALGIMTTYTALGSIAAATGSLFGSFMANPWVNIFLSALMCLLAFTMLGLFNFNAFQNFGNKVGQGKKGIQAAFFMGIGAGFIASPCTGPILGVLLGYAATQNNIMESTALLITYSFGFAIPYVALGSFAGKMTRMQVSASVFSIVKILFSGTMFALSFYYLRIPLYQELSLLAPYWAHICLISGCFAASIILVIIKSNKSSFLMSLAALSLGLSLFSMTRLSFSKNHNNLWLKNEKIALETAKNENRPLLIDMWAEWCESCKKMDATTFSSEEVINYFQKHHWVLLKLDLTQDTPETQSIQKRYQLAGLPTLIFHFPNGQKESKAGYLSDKDLLEYLKEIK